MKRLLSKRVMVVFCFLLLGLFLMRPGVGWMKTRVSNSISQGLGRAVQVGAVRFRFLPRPGFELDDLVVYDDPSFGAEPLMRASEVDAAISLGAVFRGRIEISRLSLTDPSINLTRNSQGRWNLEDLLDRTSHSIMAPTGTQRSGAEPTFPYIEANDARINFKLGTEKTHFAFTSADFAFWQESEDAWGARLEARPIRTDANLTDTGVINVEALWRRSAQVHQTPLTVSFQWKQAQMGQVSKLIFGTEKDWRGAALLSGSIAGTLDRVRIVGDASVNDFRREDVIGGGNLRLAAHCSGEYTPAIREIAGLDCTGPIGGGYMQVKGGASGILLNAQPFSTSDLWVLIDHVPTSTLISTLQHADPDVPRDLRLDGDVSSDIQVQRPDPQHPISIHGTGSINALQIGRSGLDPVPFGTIPFSVTNRSEPASNRKAEGRETTRKDAGGPRSQELRVEFEPVDLAPGKSATLLAQATLSRSGFTGAAHGEVVLSRLLHIANALGIPAPSVEGEGSTSVNLRVSGAWFSPQRPLLTGTAHLRVVQAQVRGLNAPLRVQSADLKIDKDSVVVQNLAAEAADAAWHGSLDIPRPCGVPSDCSVHFNLHADKLSASALNDLLNPAVRPKAWYRFLSLSRDQPSYLLQARAEGKIVVDKLILGKTVCSHLTSNLHLNGGNVEMSGFQAECLGGTATGDWEANFRSSPPEYKGTGSLEKISLASIADLMNNSWIEGSGSANYQFKASGSSLQDLPGSADLTAQFKLSGGRFAHVVLARGSGPLSTSDFTGTLRLADRSFSFREAKLTSGGEVYTVSGTASLGGALNLKMVTESAGYTIGGTLVRTRVATIPKAEAALKP